MLLQDFLDQFPSAEGNHMAFLKQKAMFRWTLSRLLHRLPHYLFQLSATHHYKSQNSPKKKNINKNKKFQYIAVVINLKKFQWYLDIDNHNLLSSNTNLKNFFCQFSVSCILDHKSMERTPNSLAKSMHCAA